MLRTHSPRRTNAAAALAAAAAYGLAAQAQPSRTSEAPAEETRVTPLLTLPLVGIPGKEASMVTVEYAPGGASPPHRHNASVFVYVLERGRDAGRGRGGNDARRGRHLPRAAERYPRGFAQRERNRTREDTRLLCQRRGCAADRAAGAGLSLAAAGLARYRSPRHRRPACAVLRAVITRRAPGGRRSIRSCL